MTEYPATYDRARQRLHIRLGKGEAKKLTQIHVDLYLETDAHDNLVGLEILGPAATALYQGQNPLRIAFH